MLTLWQAVILGAVQGLTEFFPVSSTAHLALFPWLLGWPDPGLTFDVALHAGTLLAVVVYFFTTWIRILKSDLRLLGLILMATIPAAISGYLFEERADSTLRNPLIIAASLIVVALLMAWADRRPRQVLQENQVNWREALGVGLAQAAAVIPGVSRSGSTITAGLGLGLRREAAARFSFLLSTPIIAGAVLKKGLELHKSGIPAGMALPFLAGTLVSAVVGIACIGLFIRFLKLRTLRFFVYYRIALGAVIVGVYLLRR